MTDQEAKFILQAYRPNGADATDANFGEALEQARKDPALGDWFRRQQEFDRAIAAQLGSVAPPPGLREAILTGGRVSRRPERTWSNSWWLAAAAAIAACVVVTLAVWPKRAAAMDISEFVVVDAKNSGTHGGHGAEAGALQVILSQATTRLGGRLPIDFNTLRTTGCRTIGFGRLPVLEVCFKRDGTWFHCYVVRRADLPAVAAPLRPQVSEKDGVHLATWGDDAHVYFVVSKSGREPLERLI